jgi:hypothetical protein
MSEGDALLCPKCHAGAALGASSDPPSPASTARPGACVRERMRRSTPLVQFVAPPMPRVADRRATGSVRAWTYPDDRYVNGNPRVVKYARTIAAYSASGATCARSHASARSFVGVRRGCSSTMSSIRAT